MYLRIWFARGDMLHSGRKIIAGVLDRLGYALLKKEDVQRLSVQGIKDALRRDNVMSHFMPRGYPPLKYAFTNQVEPTDEDKAIARRLLRFYHTCKAEKDTGRKPEGDVWEGLQTGYHRHFIALLDRNDPEQLAAYLCNMSRYDAAHGLLQGATVYDDLQAHEDTRQWIATWHFDKLVCLAEALGCVPCENPEQGHFGENLYLNVEDVLDMVEKKVGIDMRHPAVLGGLFGLDTSRGVLEFHYFFGMYAAWRILQVLGRRENISVCEIGGGIGFTAHAAYRLGINDYSIFDLPYVSVMAGYYLIKVLPNASVCLYGEHVSSNEAAIRLYPYWHYARATNTSFDLTLNQDSFPEIDIEIVKWYLDSMPRNTKHFFLSINQEGQAAFDTSGKGQLFVPALLRDRDTYELVYRFPYWLRKGYTEELYRITI